MAKKKILKHKADIAVNDKEVILEKDTAELNKQEDIEDKINELKDIEGECEKNIVIESNMTEEEKIMTKDFIVKDIESFERKLEVVRKAQREFAKMSQEQVDKIFLSAALAANHKRLELAKMAVEETKMGVFEDKVIKNNYAAEYTYNAYKNTKTCGVLEEDAAFGLTKIAEPIGVIAAVIPTTNPTSTAIFKTLISLKTRNGIIISPHPRAKNCTIEAAKVVYEAAVKAGAPEGIIAWVDEPSIELTASMMKEADIILATGGPQMVHSAYSSGKPALGVGAGNVPALIDESADIKMAVNSIIVSKSFDNGMICASEQSVLVPESKYDEVKKEFADRGAYILNADEVEKFRKIILNENGGLNAGIVGQSAYNLGKMAGVDVPEYARIVVGEVTETDFSEPFAHEKLSPILAMYKYKTYDEAIEKAEHLVEQGGLGHTSSLYIDTINCADKMNQYISSMKTCRVVINTPSAHGGIGDLYNFKLEPSFTLGCGSWGGNSVSENVGVKHLINIKTVAERRENMLWFRTPGKVYFKKGCLPVAMKEFKEEMDKKRAFIVTDKFLHDNGYIDRIKKELDDMGIMHTTFFDVTPDPTLECAKKGAAAMTSFEPDLIIAVGGGSAMDAAKIMWVLYEHPDVNFADMAMTFMDIRKRAYKFPKMGQKAYFCAIPTSAGTGSEVTPFAVITDTDADVKYPIADYELLPNMAIIDADLQMEMPKGLTAASGIDALVHSLEAYVSMLRTEPSDSMALKAGQTIFKYLPKSYECGNSDIEAKEKMAIAATMAGMSFANAFLGVCHSMAHKLGNYHHIPHGVANALLIEEVIKYNCSEAPFKMGTFSQYKYPDCVERYAEFARFCGVESGKSDRETVDNLLKAIADLKSKLNIPSSIKEYGIDEKKFMETLDSMSLHAFDDQCTGANPRYPLVEELKNMYLNAYYGE